MVAIAVNCPECLGVVNPIAKRCVHCGVLLSKRDRRIEKWQRGSVQLQRIGMGITASVFLLGFAAIALLVFISLILGL